MRLTLTIFFFISAISFGQNTRFKDKTFDELTVHSSIVYGQSITQSGIIMDLTMDIYEPKDDPMEKRPVVILAHGGYFFFGEKEDFQPECEQLAQAGYVAVSINYRLIDIDDDSFYVAKRAVIDAITDMKAAVRFFYKDADKKNKYRVDTDNIFIGGYSAGAITSLHYAYANTREDLEMMGGREMVQYVSKIGGLEGNSGNEGYPSKVRGVINIAGALFDANMVDKNEPILFSIHGTDDDVVPFKEGLAGTTKVTTQGSSMIHKRADKIGLKNKLMTLKKGDHFTWLDCEECMLEVLSFLNENLKK